MAAICGLITFGVDRRAYVQPTPGILEARWRPQLQIGAMVAPAARSGQFSDAVNTLWRRRCYTNDMSIDELLAEALRLTRVDRARVAEELLSSLEESDEEVATAWATELERRSREIAEGHVQTISWETARTEILKELEQRRAPRTAS